jgi:methionyl-tRNA formyltransferase
MRIGFAGSPDFAAAALQAILDAGLPVVLALTQPDRPRDRGLRPKPGPVKALALAKGIPLLQPRSLRSEADCAPIVAIPLDVLVVAAYGLLLPKPILDWPRQGCINIHASLLPRWRGAAPIQRAILAGDSETGITLMRIDEGLDTGPIIAQHPLPIAPRETGGSLRDKLARMGGAAIVQALAQLQRDGFLPAQSQFDAGVTYAAKIDSAETVIDWRQSAAAIDRRVRAFAPAPGAQTSWSGAVLKIWEATPLEGDFRPPGAVLRSDASGILVACGEGALNVTELQRAGGKRITAAAFLAGRPVATATRLGSANVESLGGGAI